MEGWRNANIGDGSVEVSNLGNVRRLSRQVLRTRKSCSYIVLHKPKEIKPWIGRNGYLTISLQFNKTRPKFAVHRLIGKAFVDGYMEGLTINHINGNRFDNRADNLEWITLNENTRKQWLNGQVNLRGENQPTHKLSAKQVLSVITGVSHSCICLIRDRKRWNSI
jgi:hypothetical protein